MLPKCVLQVSPCGGHRHKPHSIEELCRLWSDGHLASLWQYASGHARKANSKSSKEQTKETDRKVQSAVSKAREGLLGRHARFSPLLGLPPNTPETWNLLQQKHPRVLSHHAQKSHYLWKVSSCLQTLTSCLSFINFLEIVLVAPQDCEYST